VANEPAITKVVHFSIYSDELCKLVLMSEPSGGDGILRSTAQDMRPAMRQRFLRMSHRIFLGHINISNGGKVTMTAQPATAMQSVKGPAPGRQSPIELLEQFDKVYDSIARRAFELFKGNGQTAGHELDDWIRAEAELLHPVRLEMTESDEFLTVLAEVPGFAAKDVEIKVEPRRLIIAGRREIKEDKNGRKIQCEWCADQMLRVVNLPTEVDINKVNATVRDGILQIDLPKAAHAKATRIEPRSA
jgi:HSP20 family protein